MQRSGDSFDHMVAGLSIDDRVSILQQMKNQIKPNIDLLSKKELAEDVVIPKANTLKNETFFTRIILFFKSIFSNQSIEVVYADHKIIALTKRLDSKYSDYFNAQRMSLEQSFYDFLLELKSVADTFKSDIALSEEHNGSFLILLGSLVMTDIEEKINKASDPYSIPFSQELTNDLRTSLIRKMEVVLSEVSSANRSELYTCVQSYIWLKAFIELPFESLAAKFSVGANGKVSCGLSTAVNDLEKITNIVANSKNVEPEVLEALYLFQSQMRINSGEEINVQAGVESHMTSSLNALKCITRFINSVPMRSLTMVAKHSLSWTPMYKDSGEDWFVQYKAQWRRVFDKKWNHWLHERKIETTKDQVAMFFKTNTYPLFPNRPWKIVQSVMSFSKEYTFGFLYKFFSEKYIQYNDVLKILMVDGDFVLRDNKTEFVDTYTESNHLIQNIRELNEKLSPKGVYGTQFASITADLLRTVQGQLQIQTLMTTIESEVNLLVLSFGNICRSYNAVFSGILVSNYNPNYDTISNIAVLTGPDNAPIRKHLVEVSECISTAFGLLQEIEAIELVGIPNEIK